MSVFRNVIRVEKIRRRRLSATLAWVSFGLVTLLVSTVACSLVMADDGVVPVGSSTDRGGSWYLGIGAGVSRLHPEPADPDIRSSSTNGTYGGFVLGRKLSGPFAAEAHLHLPGRGKIGTADVDYMAVDLALRYRLVAGRSAGNRQTEVFALAGFGSIDRSVNSAIELENDTRFHFSAGLGAEVFVGDAVSLRAQALYLDTDVQLANLSLVWHWDSKSQFGDKTDRSANTVEASAAPSASAAVTARKPDVKPQRNSSARQDLDADGVADRSDLCADSRPGFPVHENGCALFDGVLPGVRFVAGSSRLMTASLSQLDALIAKLLEYPDATVALLAYTDNQGSVREQAILTRARLKTIATYLSRQGIAANRLVLKSMGASQPLHDNATAIGRERNNRVEIREHDS